MPEMTVSAEQHCTGSIRPTDRVGRLAAKFPQASRVFARHNIDYCCGGNRALHEACANAGLETQAIVDEIKHEILCDRTSSIAPDTLALDELIIYIQKKYHEPLREELLRIEAMAAKVAHVHAARDGQRLTDLSAAVSVFKDRLLEHIDKEDRILFPMINAGNGVMARMPINRMQHDHDDHADSLRQIRSLTNDFAIPSGACMTWRALWLSLAELERSLHEHIHLENNILFPKTLAD